MYASYCRLLGGLSAAAGLLLLATALWIDRPGGDLTRLGGFSENEFGWNGAQHVFAPPLARAGDDGAAIIVVGDSFSLRTSPDRQTPEGGFWTDFLAAETELHVGVFNVDDMSIAARLQLLAARADPPRLVVLELAERTLARRLAGPATCADDDGSALAGPDIAAPLAAPPPLATLRPTLRPTQRPTGPLLRADAAGQSADFLKKSALRLLAGDMLSPVRKLALARDDLFTSRRGDALLVYREDFDKQRWTGADFAAMRCRLQAARRMVEANGRTRFLFLMAPDKSTAYAAHLLNPLPAADTMARLGLPFAPRLDLALRAAIASDMRDVYLPDDTHWGSAGSRIAAAGILDRLRPRYAAMP